MRTGKTFPGMQCLSIFSNEKIHQEGCLSIFPGEKLLEKGGLSIFPGEKIHQEGGLSIFYLVKHVMAIESIAQITGLSHGKLDEIIKTVG